MTFSISHLGPAGTYTEQAAMAYAEWWAAQTQQPLPTLKSFSSIAQTLFEVAEGHVDVAIAPVENSIEGSVTATLDTLWQVDNLRIRQAVILPIVHVLAAKTRDLSTLSTVCSHPQALGQCRGWLQANLPEAQLIPTSSTTESLKSVQGSIAAIASERAVQLYDLPILARSIQDYSDNCTRFLVVNRPESTIVIPKIAGPVYTSIAFSLMQNSPGVLVKILQIFAERQINLSRIESRPSKRSLGDYVFFIDAEVCHESQSFQSVLKLLVENTESLRILGSYSTLEITADSTLSSVASDR